MVPDLWVLARVPPDDYRILGPWMKFNAAWLLVGNRWDDANAIRSVVPMVADEEKRILVLRPRSTHERDVELPA